MVKLKKIKIQDMLDDSYYWVKGYSNVYIGAQWKLYLRDEKSKKYKDMKKEEVVEAYEFRDDK